MAEKDYPINSPNRRRRFDPVTGRYWIDHLEPTLDAQGHQIKRVVKSVRDPNQDDDADSGSRTGTYYQGLPNFPSTADFLAAKRARDPRAQADRVRTTPPPISSPMAKRKHVPRFWSKLNPSQADLEAAREAFGTLPQAKKTSSWSAQAVDKAKRIAAAESLIVRQALSVETQIRNKYRQTNQQILGRGGDELKLRTELQASQAREAAEIAALNQAVRSGPQRIALASRLARELRGNPTASQVTDFASRLLHDMVGQAHQTAPVPSQGARGKPLVPSYRPSPRGDYRGSHPVLPDPEIFTRGVDPLTTIRELRLKMAEAHKAARAQGNQQDQARTAAMVKNLNTLERAWRGKDNRGVAGALPRSAPSLQTDIVAVARRDAQWMEDALQIIQGRSTWEQGSRSHDPEIAQAFGRAGVGMAGPVDKGTVQRRQDAIDRALRRKIELDGQELPMRSLFARSSDAYSSRRKQKTDYVHPQFDGERASALKAFLQTEQGKEIAKLYPDEGKAVADLTRVFKYRASMQGFFREAEARDIKGKGGKREGYEGHLDYIPDRDAPHRGASYVDPSNVTLRDLYRSNPTLEMRRDLNKLNLSLHDTVGEAIGRMAHTRKLRDAGTPTTLGVETGMAEYLPTLLPAMERLLKQGGSLNRNEDDGQTNVYHAFQGSAGDDDEIGDSAWAQIMTNPQFGRTGLNKDEAEYEQGNRPWTYNQLLHRFQGVTQSRLKQSQFVDMFRVMAGTARATGDETYASSYEQVARKAEMELFTGSTYRVDGGFRDEDSKASPYGVRADQFLGFNSGAYDLFGSRQGTWGETIMHLKSGPRIGRQKIKGKQGKEIELNLAEDLRREALMEFGGPGALSREDALIVSSSMGANLPPGWAKMNAKERTRWAKEYRGRELPDSPYASLHPAARGVRGPLGLYQALVSSTRERFGLDTPSLKGEEYGESLELLRTGGQATSEDLAILEALTERAKGITPDVDVLPMGRGLGNSSITHFLPFNPLFSAFRNEIEDGGWAKNQGRAAKLRASGGFRYMKTLMRHELPGFEDANMPPDEFISLFRSRAGLQQIGNDLLDVSGEPVNLGELTGDEQVKMLHRAFRGEFFDWGQQAGFRMVNEHPDPKKPNPTQKTPLDIAQSLVERGAINRMLGTPLTGRMLREADASGRTRPLFGERDDSEFHQSDLLLDKMDGMVGDLFASASRAPKGKELDELTPRWGAGPLWKTKEDDYTSPQKEKMKAYREAILAIRGDAGLWDKEREVELHKVRSFDNKRKAQELQQSMLYFSKGSAAAQSWLHNTMGGGIGQTGTGLLVEGSLAGQDKYEALRAQREHRMAEFEHTSLDKAAPQLYGYLTGRTKDYDGGDMGAVGSHAPPGERALEMSMVLNAAFEAIASQATVERGGKKIGMHQVDETMRDFRKRTKQEFETYLQNRDPKAVSGITMTRAMVAGESAKTGWEAADALRGVGLRSIETDAQAQRMERIYGRLLKQFHGGGALGFQVEDLKEISDLLGWNYTVDAWSPVTTVVTDPDDETIQREERLGYRSVARNLPRNILSSEETLKHVVNGKLDIVDLLQQDDSKNFIAAGTSAFRHLGDTGHVDNLLQSNRRGYTEVDPRVNPERVGGFSQQMISRIYGKYLDAERPDSALGKLLRATHVDDEGREINLVDAKFKLKGAARQFVENQLPQKNATDKLTRMREKLAQIKAGKGLPGHALAGAGSLLGLGVLAGSAALAAKFGFDPMGLGDAVAHGKEMLSQFKEAFGVGGGGSALAILGATRGTSSFPAQGTPAQPPVSGSAGRGGGGTPPPPHPSRNPSGGYEFFQDPDEAVSPIDFMMQALAQHSRLGNKPLYDARDGAYASLSEADYDDPRTIQGLMGQTWTADQMKAIGMRSRPGGAPMVVTGNPGSGKTDVESARVLHQLDDPGMTPEGLPVIVSFARASVRASMKALQPFMDKEAFDRYTESGGVSTIHSLGMRTINDLGWSNVFGRSGQVGRDQDGAPRFDARDSGVEPGMEFDQFAQMGKSHQIELFRNALGELWDDQIDQFGHADATEIMRYAGTAMPFQHTDEGLDVRRGERNGMRDRIRPFAAIKKELVAGGKKEENLWKAVQMLAETGIRPDSLKEFFDPEVDNMSGYQGSEQFKSLRNEMWLAAQVYGKMDQMAQRGEWVDNNTPDPKLTRFFQPWDLVNKPLQHIQDHTTYDLASGKRRIAPEIRDSLANWFGREYVISEDQDANLGQLSYLELLAGGAHNLFKSGDPKQDLYPWRGGTRRWLKLAAEAAQKSGSYVHLAETFRFTGGTATFLDKLHKAMRFQGQDGTNQPLLPEPPLRPAGALKDIMAGPVAAEVHGYRDKLSHEEAEDWEHEVMAQHIRHLTGMGVATSGEGLSWDRETRAIKQFRLGDEQAAAIEGEVAAIGSPPGIARFGNFATVARSNTKVAEIVERYRDRGIKVMAQFAREKVEEWTELSEKAPFTNDELRKVLQSKNFAEFGETPDGSAFVDLMRGGDRGRGAYADQPGSFGGVKSMIEDVLTARRYLSLPHNGQDPMADPDEEINPEDYVQVYTIHGFKGGQRKFVQVPSATERSFRIQGTESPVKGREGFVELYTALTRGAQAFMYALKGRGKISPVAAAAQEFAASGEMNDIVIGRAPKKVQPVGEFAGPASVRSSRVQHDWDPLTNKVLRDIDAGGGGKIGAFAGGGYASPEKYDRIVVGEEGPEIVIKDGQAKKFDQPAVLNLRGSGARILNAEETRQAEQRGMGAFDMGAAALGGIWNAAKFLYRGPVREEPAPPQHAPRMDGGIMAHFADDGEGAVQAKELADMLRSIVKMDADLISAPGQGHVVRATPASKAEAQLAKTAILAWEGQKTRFDPTRTNRETYLPLDEANPPEHPAFEGLAHTALMKGSGSGARAFGRGETDKAAREAANAIATPLEEAARKVTVFTKAMGDLTVAVDNQRKKLGTDKSGLVNTGQASHHIMAQATDAHGQPVTSHGSLLKTIADTDVQVPPQYDASGARYDWNPDTGRMEPAELGAKAPRGFLDRIGFGGGGRGGRTIGRGGVDGNAIGDVPFGRFEGGIRGLFDEAAMNSWKYDRMAQFGNEAFTAEQQAYAAKGEETRAANYALAQGQMLPNIDASGDTFGGQLIGAQKWLTGNFNSQKEYWEDRGITRADYMRTGGVYLAAGGGGLDQEGMAGMNRVALEAEAAGENIGDAVLKYLQDSPQGQQVNQAMDTANEVAFVGTSLGVNPDEYLRMTRQLGVVSGVTQQDEAFTKGTAGIVGRLAAQSPIDINEFMQGIKYVAPSMMPLMGSGGYGDKYGTAESMGLSFTNPDGSAKSAEQLDKEKTGLTKEAEVLTVMAKGVESGLTSEQTGRAMRSVVQSQYSMTPRQSWLYAKQTGVVDAQGQYTGTYTSNPQVYQELMGQEDRGYQLEQTEMQRVGAQLNRETLTIEAASIDLQAKEVTLDAAKFKEMAPIQKQAMIAGNAVENISYQQGLRQAAAQVAMQPVEREVFGMQQEAERADLARSQRSVAATRSYEDLLYGAPGTNRSYEAYFQVGANRAAQGQGMQNVGNQVGAMVGAVGLEAAQTYRGLDYQATMLTLGQSQLNSGAAYAAQMKYIEDQKGFAEEKFNAEGGLRTEQRSIEDEALAERAELLPKVQELERLRFEETMRQGQEAYELAVAQGAVLDASNQAFAVNLQYYDQETKLREEGFIIQEQSLENQKKLNEQRAIENEQLIKHLSEVIPLMTDFNRAMLAWIEGKGANEGRTDLAGNDALTGYQDPSQYISTILGPAPGDELLSPEEQRASKARTLVSMFGEDMTAAPAGSMLQGLYGAVNGGDDREVDRIMKDVLKDPQAFIDQINKAQGVGTNANLDLNVGASAQNAAADGSDNIAEPVKQLADEVAVLSGEINGLKGNLGTLGGLFNALGGGLVGSTFEAILIRILMGGRGKGIKGGGALAEAGEIAAKDGAPVAKAAGPVARTAGRVAKVAGRAIGKLPKAGKVGAVVAGLVVGEELVRRWDPFDWFGDHEASAAEEADPSKKGIHPGDIELPTGKKTGGGIGVGGALALASMLPYGTAAKGFGKLTGKAVGKGLGFKGGLAAMSLGLGGELIDWGAGKAGVDTKGAFGTVGTAAGIGATVGSIIPGVGTVAGGLVGAGIGAGIVGFQNRKAIGGWMGDHGMGTSDLQGYSDKAADWLNKTGASAVELGEKIFGGVQDLAGDVLGAFLDPGDFLKEHAPEGLQGAAEFVGNIIQAFTNPIGFITEGLPEIMGSAGEFVAGIAGWLGSLGSAIGGFFEERWDELTGVGARIGNWILGLPDAVIAAGGEVFGDMKGLGKQMMNGLIIDPINTVLDAISGLKIEINNAPDINVPDIPNIPRFAMGTPYAPGGLALVGEQGPELVRLNRGDGVIPTRETMRMLKEMAPTRDFLVGAQRSIAEVDTRVSQYQERVFSLHPETARNIVGGGSGGNHVEVNITIESGASVDEALVARLKAEVAREITRIMEE